MLYISRRPGEAIRIGKDIVIEVQSIRGTVAHLSVRAPPELSVWREEIHEARTAPKREHRGGKR